jgi:hypothetical protein
MDTLVIYLTGLLLFAPDPTTNQMHVLAPDVKHGVPHVVQIGMFKADDGTCTEYVEAKRSSDETGICYYDLDEWSLDLLVPGDSAALALPSGVLNLTDEYRTPLPQERFTIHPDDGVRARITLGAGSVTDSCALAEWNFGTRRQPLVNVIEWTIPNFPAGGSLVLNRINRERYEVWETHQRVITLPLARADRRIPIVIRHVRRDEDTAENPEGFERATHFGEFYRLLGVSPPGFLPNRDSDKAKLECPIGEDLFGNGFVEYLRGPRTYSCMVAAAYPQ